MKQSIMQTRYIKKNMTKEWLISNNFHYNRIFSDDETEVYTYRFPVYKYDCFTVLDCEFKVTLGESTVTIDVYDYNTINRYTPFYYQEYGSYDKMLKEIWEKIDRSTIKLGIEKRTINEGKYKETKRKRNNPNKRKQRGSRI